VTLNEELTLANEHIASLEAKVAELEEFKRGALLTFEMHDAQKAVDSNRMGALVEKCASLEAKVAELVGALSRLCDLAIATARVPGLLPRRPLPKDLIAKDDQEAADRHEQVLCATCGHVWGDHYPDGKCDCACTGFVASPPAEEKPK
jgi:hypothetical protein